MPDTGLLLPGSANQGAGWLNPTNLLADDGSVATTNGTQTTTGNLRAFSFSTSFPDGIASLDGIAIEFEVTALTGTATLNVGIMTNGVSPLSTQAVDPQPGVYTLGGEGTLWGAQLANIIGNSSFGVVFQMDSIAGAQLSIDYAKVRVLTGWKGLSSIDWSRFPK